MMRATRVLRTQVSAATMMLGETREELMRADGKISMLLASVGIIAGVVMAALITGDWSPADLGGCRMWGWLTGAASWMAAIVVLAAGLYPRTKRARDPQAVHHSYYGDVSPGTSASQLTVPRTDQEVLARLKDQLAAISLIVGRKYRAIRVAIWLLGGGAALMTAASVATLFG